MELSTRIIIIVKKHVLLKEVLGRKYYQKEISVHT